MQPFYKLNRSFLVWAIILIALSQQHIMITPVGAEEKTYTAEKRQSANKPETWLTPEVKLKKNGDPENRSWFSRNKWWVALGVVLAGGVAVAAAGSNDGGDTLEGATYTNSW